LFQGCFEQAYRERLDDAVMPLTLQNLRRTREGRTPSFILCHRASELFAFLARFFCRIALLSLLFWFCILLVREQRQPFHTVSSAVLLQQ
jgi:hypothetical protein